MWVISARDVRGRRKEITATLFIVSAETLSFIDMVRNFLVYALITRVDAAMHGHV